MLHYRNFRQEKIFSICLRDFILKYVSKNFIPSHSFQFFSQAKMLLCLRYLIGASAKTTHLWFEYLTSACPYKQCAGLPPIAMRYPASCIIEEDRRSWLTGQCVLIYDLFVQNLFDRDMLGSTFLLLLFVSPTGVQLRATNRKT